MSVVVSVEDVSKYYRLGMIGARTLSQDLNRWWARVRARPDPLQKIGQADYRELERESIWALRDIRFQVRQGEALGIIGRNGAGKSTLLKILSRVTAPTRGEVKIRGRMASLLEVGTGFHPELTGRENIFLNGVILGMRRSEISRKLDEIIDFSGVEKYVDTPVKRYSSGMYVRLAFAVAAYLDPEILVVDEVLAVGDAAFQKKSLGKMEDASRNEGRTVLFVSHNMGMITSLCQRALLLDGGRLVMDGPVAEAVSAYYSEGSNSPFSVDYSKADLAIGDEFATLLEAHIETEDGKRIGEVDIRSPFLVKMKYALRKNVPIAPYPNFHFFNSNGQCAFVAAGERLAAAAGEGIYEAACIVPPNFLNNDTYFIGLALTFTHAGLHVSFHAQKAISVVIRDPINETLDTLRNGYSGPMPGSVRPKLEWEIKKIS